VAAAVAVAGGGDDDGDGDDFRRLENVGLRWPCV